MVYCQHCGQQNDDNAESCVECGATLQAREPTREVRRPGKTGHPKDDECFGLPNGDAICGVIFGGIIIIAGLSWILGWDLTTLWETVFPYLIITFGALIILGAIYSSTRKKRRYQ